MVAYSFRSRFVPRILVGLGRQPSAADSMVRQFSSPRIAYPAKRQTIRSPRTGRSRHARPGETLQLYYAMRTKAGLKIGVARCVSVHGIKISFRAEDDRNRIEVSTPQGPCIWTDTEQLNEFAVADGFADWADMQEFWKEEHGDLKRLGPFVGVLIRWEPLS